MRHLEVRRTCIDLSYQRFAPFFSLPPPCSISKALVVSLASRPLGSSRHTRHRQLSIRARESLLVWSGQRRETCWFIGLKSVCEVEKRLSGDLLSAHLWLVPILFSRPMSGCQKQGVSLQHFLPFSWFSPVGIKSPARWAACCLRLHPTRKTSEKNRLQKSCVPLLNHLTVSQFLSDTACSSWYVVSAVVQYWTKKTQTK